MFAIVFSIKSFFFNFIKLTIPYNILICIMCLVDQKVMCNIRTQKPNYTILFLRKSDSIKL